jgi:hypothetical protein
MNADAVSLIESILADAAKTQKNLEKLRALGVDGPELQEAIERSEEHAALLRRIRKTVEGRDDILELD